MAADHHFTRFAAIDWSGAKGARHPGIAVALCEAGDAAPELIPPPGRAWARGEVLDWVMALADEPILIGFDFSFSAPFVARGAHLPGETEGDDARALWAHVEAASDDPDLGAAGFIDARRGTHFYLGAADGAKADFLHWRACEIAHDGSTKPSTVFDAIGAAQVSKASFAGMRLLHRLNGRVPLWPFDPMPKRGACVVEIYTAIAARAAGARKGRSKIRDARALDKALAALGTQPHAPLTVYNDDATDALLTAAWLRRAAHDPALWQPRAMTPAIARAEGWTFGIA
ncbi:MULTISPECIES: hypothetical protein [unclassified Sphingomonas]|uniref:hypothetical protein n=1 Tax=unclassified Sphingomonas TaxID=196159 RepID=UPI00215194E4|nr:MULTISPECIES: hypothetical protein [unclassified Sphingomonas]MCR5872588.1 hypothetical protein [Sphingomonas sp. J344]UUX99126.1 hypothetical protein LRS08_16830 [Sphingomonas sp. J315]